jgi:hypothetical protein
MWAVSGRAVSERALIGLLIVAALTGCGVRRDLKPLATNTLPVAPFGRADQPSSADLLKPTTQAVPERSVELREQSEKRGDDPFDLPPAN